MRPGKPEDLPAVGRLWEEEVELGRRDCAPTEIRRRQWLTGFDWPSRSRIVDGDGDRLDGAVVVTDRPGPAGTVARVEVATSARARRDLAPELARWGVGLSRAAGARAVQIWCAKGDGAWAAELGLKSVRPWWRMDRGLTPPLPEPRPVAGYELQMGNRVQPGSWADMHNRTFADHWRYSPRSEDELMTGRPLELAMMVFAPDGSPAALTLSQVETYAADRRAQPVGIVSSVGTLPAHRRRGLATWLVARALGHLSDAGACSGSLYVDGWNESRAADAYRKLGFELAFETEVWEATFP